MDASSSTALGLSPSDIVLICSTLILALAAFVAPYAIERWKHRFFAPKLRFEFFHRPPYCHLTKMRTSSVEFPVYYFRCIVVNEGRSQAEQCEAVLETIAKENSNGRLEEWGGFSPASLVWSGAANSKYLTIQPGRKIFCNIGRIQHPQHEPESAYKDISAEEKKSNKFFLELQKRLFVQWDCLVPGKYQIELAVYSSNSKKVSKKFRLAWSGNWRDEEANMLKELVISSD
jgi:hypothetical protein